MHQALPAVGHQVRLRRAPVAQRRRPLLRPAQVEDLLAGLDHGAVDDPGDDRRHLAGGDGDHHLVEQRHALRGPPSRSAPGPGRAGRAPSGPGRRSGRRSRRPGEGGVRGGGVALVEALQPDRHEQVALLAQSSWASSSTRWARASQPPPRADLAAVQQAEAQPERAAGGPRRVGPDQNSRCARAKTSALSSSRPIRWAAVASSSRSSGSSGASRSAAESWAYASAHACRPKAS